MENLNRKVIAALTVAMFSLAPVIADTQTLPRATPDVLVVGGTPAGVAAAVTAAREGDRVTLVSASDDLGGTLTDAMMDQWPNRRSIPRTIRER